MLRDSGFSGVNFDVMDDLDHRAHQYSIIVSTASEHPEELRSNLLRGPFETCQPSILIDEDSTPQRAVAESLKAKFKSEGLLSCSI